MSAASTACQQLVKHVSSWLRMSAASLVQTAVRCAKCSHVCQQLSRTKLALLALFSDAAPRTKLKQTSVSWPSWPVTGLPLQSLHVSTCLAVANASGDNLEIKPKIKQGKQKIKQVEIKQATTLRIVTTHRVKAWHTQTNLTHRTKARHKLSINTELSQHIVLKHAIH
jgi:hypothetical protein